LLQRVLNDNKECISPMVDTISHYPTDRLLLHQD